MNESSCLYIDATHTIKLVDDLEYEDVPWDRVRTHRLSLLFQKFSPLWVRLLVVTDDIRIDDLDDHWREISMLPRPQELGRKMPAEAPTIPILLSSSFNHILQPLSLMQLARLFEIQVPLRILSDKLYFVEHGRSTIETTFECSGSFTTILEHETADQYFYDFEYLLRITPLNVMQYLAPPSLPPSVLRRIGALGMDHEDIAADSRILSSWALINKEWFSSGILNLIWKSSGWRNSLLLLQQFQSFAQCLRQCPSIAPRVLCFPRHVVWYGDTEWESSDWLQPADDILRLALNLEDIDLRSFEFNYSQERLRSLRQVHEFTISPYHRTHVPTTSDWDDPINIHDLVDTIAAWPNLQRLRLREFKCTKPSSETSGSHISEYQLRGLTLENGILVPEIILRMLHRPELLTQLTLSSITGLSNCNFKDLFLHIKKSVKSLSVSNCTIPMVEEGEELAFDAVADQMVRLHHIYIQANLISSTGLRPNPYGIGIYICVWKWRFEHGKTVEQLRDAIALAGWETINIVLDAGDTETSQTDYSSIERVAKEKGIQLSIRVA